MTQWTDTLPDDSPMVALLRQTDWSATPLGPVETWDASLRTSAGLVLRSRFPLLIGWGPELVQIYNDAMVPLLGAKHPQFGRRIRDTWPEIWDVVGPMLQGVMDTGEATWAEDALLLINRYGYPEDIYITFSYSALADDEGRPAGVLATTVITTERVVDARRMQVLNDVAALCAAASSAPKLADDLLSALARHPEDLRFATLHLDTEGGGLSLAAGTHPASELDAPLDGHDDSGAWSLQHTGSRELRYPVLPTTALPEQLQEPVRDVVVLPVQAGEAGNGLLSVGRSPHRLYDEKYRSFLEVLAQQVGTGLASAAARESERRRLEELAALDRAKGDFLGDVSHEFRTPLTLLTGPLRTLLSGGRLDPEDTVRVQLALRATDRLTRLVDTLLDYTRAESGALSADPIALTLDHHVRSVAELFRTAVEEAGLTLVVDAEPLPHAVHADAQQVETVLVNLLANALKFTRRGEIRVLVRACPRGGVIEVHDTGMGIADDELPYVFDRFRRSRTSEARSVEGAGIGLSLARKLVELQGGSISVRSRPGAGTVFRVELPWSTRPAHGDVTPTPRVSAVADEARSWSAGPSSPGLVESLLPRVVVVEDNADVRSFLTGVLTGHAQVEAVPDGAAALRALRARGADLVLTDVRMPVMDGLALLATIRNDPELAALPVVLLSAHADRDAAVQALTAGADDYLVKPFTPAELVARVRSTIALTQTRRQAAALHARMR
jgi:signal transduction histidine kinase/AmiR/NasT family two-component response regulator